MDIMIKTLQGKKGLIVGIADDKSIAWGCAKAFHQAGADLAITYLNSKAEPHVRSLAEQVLSPIIMPLNVTNDDQMQDLFEKIKQKWGKLDFLLHAIAFVPKEDLHAKILECSKDGFLVAMDISCHSFIRMAHLATPLMKDGGCMLTTTYYGSEKVVEQYGIMGPVKAALESTVKYMAAELGEKKIRVNALSSGPIATRAASGIINFAKLLKDVKKRSPIHELICADCVGAYARFLVSDEARLVTGTTAYIDAGFNIMVT
jgi:enoyl-[acyl-carrier protein] reductase I